MDLFELVPDTEIRTWVGPFKDQRLYFKAGKIEAERFIDLAEIEPHHHVLDLGCGCGKVGIHLAQYLKTGRYTGIDNNPELLQWCYDKIAPTLSNCSFQFIDVFNGAYHTEGKLLPSDMRIDLPDNSVDVVIANSLFTHMLLEDIPPYMKEIHRVLKVGGTIAATYLLLNKASLTAIEKKEAMFDLVYSAGSLSRAKDAAQPEEGIGHDEIEIRGIYEKCRYRISAVHYGGWVRNVGKDCQDLVLATKRGC